jgi:hypothetical protein
MNEANTMADIIGQGETVEQEIQRKGLTAPRVTPADIEANIASEHYFTAGDGLRGAELHETRGSEDDDVPPLDLLTFCVLVLRNGFTVTGESACASPENFNAELGRKIARQNAVAKTWPLMGYALREQLAQAPRVGRPTIAELETILRSEDNRPVQILPNGEIRVDER